MAIPGFLSVTGKTQGKIEGSCEIQGNVGKILVEASEHLIDIPNSPQTGLPTGKRVHHPLVITKFIDKSSPKLMQALTSGEVLTEVLLEYVRIDNTGKEAVYYTTQLSNAIIVSIKSWSHNSLDTDPNKKQYGDMQDVAFTYEKIVETWKPDGIEAEDSWLAPKA
jgi:type VI secretion system secreted protein Hcp